MSRRLLFSFARAAIESNRCTDAKLNTRELACCVSVHSQAASWPRQLNLNARPFSIKSQSSRRLMGLDTRRCASWHERCHYLSRPEGWVSKYGLQDQREG